MQTFWRHKIVDDYNEATLYQAGSDWELVSVVVIDGKCRAFFKQPQYDRTGDSIEVIRQACEAWTRDRA